MQGTHRFRESMDIYIVALSDTAKTKTTCKTDTELVKRKKKKKKYLLS